MQNRLFAVYLGGRAPMANTELHDVVFAIGPTIEATYEQLMDKWFGTLEGLHLDSWLPLEIIDGYKISLSEIEKPETQKLYFVNLGAYQEHVFTEIHATMFLVAGSKAEAKLRAKQSLLRDWPSPVHTDDLHDVDDCLEIDKVGSGFINLEKTDTHIKLIPTNGYHLIPKSTVAEYVKRKQRTSY